MHGITDADRDAAKALREALAEVSGFWHRPGDDGLLCAALARHRIEAERRLVEKLSPFMPAAPGADRPVAAKRLRAPQVDAIEAPFLAALPEA